MLFALPERRMHETNLEHSAYDIRTQAEKKEVASAWLELAISCAKVPVKYEADEIKRRQKEEKTQREAEPVMA